MGRNHIAFVVALAASLHGGLGVAAHSVADPDTVFNDPATAPVINDAFPGVTFSTDVPTGSDVVALGSGVPEVPGWYPAVFGHSLINFPSGGCSGCWSFGYAVLRADFLAPVSSVEVDFIDRFPGTAVLEGYDLGGQLVGVSTMPLAGVADPGDALRVTVDLSSFGSGIAYVLAAADAGTYGVIDQVRWNISEPSTLTLLAIAGLSITGARRVRR